MQARQVGIIDFCRSPISRAKDGALNKLTPLELAAQVVKTLVGRNEAVPPDLYEMVVAGCAFPEAEQGFNFGRALGVKAGLPLSTAGVTVNQFCASSMQAVMVCADAIALGKGDAAIAVGVEHMKRVPMGGYNPHFDAELAASGFYTAMGVTAENLVKELSIPREAQDDFAMASHRKALAAWEAGVFVREVVAIDLPGGGRLERDENLREPEPDKVRGLAPAFEKDGTVTAANSSPVTTGAAAMLLMSVDRARELGLPVRAVLRSTAVAGCDPQRMGMGPLPASEKALARAGLRTDELDLIELNEAFAGQSLYVIKKAGWDADKVNVYGGAIALGHPLGMSGVRIVGTLVTALEHKGGRYGLATLCVGGGQGAAVVLESGESK